MRFGLPQPFGRGADVLFGAVQRITKPTLTTMGLFGGLFKLAADAVTLPLDVVKDVVTLGGEITDEESTILKKLGKLDDDMDELLD